MAAKKKAKRLTLGTATERIVLSVARVDFYDDNDGASFMQPEQRRAARKLAADGYLKLVSETKAEVVAKLTKSGLRLMERREAASEERPRNTGERPNLESALRSSRQAYHDASSEYTRAKQEGPSERISKAYAALGSTSAAYENAELVLKAYDRKHR